ncbi:hypothetical protein KIN20_021843 [Parelaphostrongylus tenuis]|uniref:Uncharacterized protein n=1 Tax=Parelaphostrongylus tenuis TaxID=148309 RepID=A0AAD5QUS9_PARTN|nr:hypothetical protein KIN20_021843 [Parelaphostrongylus tenuis]
MRKERLTKEAENGKEKKEKFSPEKSSKPAKEVRVSILLSRYLFCEETLKARGRVPINARRNMVWIDPLGILRQS